VSAPCIRLCGRWLEQAGFTIGSKVDVSVAHGRLVIDTAPLDEERKSRLPRHAQKVFRSVCRKSATGLKPVTD
jgi:antitoxin component of MazEF toxin-antitoxin module